MTRVLIIGCEGYIGSYLMNHLSENAVVSGIDKSPETIHSRKLHSSELTALHLSDKDVIIYLGGYNGHAQCNDKSDEDVYHENVTDIQMLAKKLTPAQTLIYASTAGVLEGSGSTPVDENYKVDVSFLSKYTRAMFYREQVITKDAEIVCKTIGLRFGTVIGVSPKQRTDLVHIAMVKSAMLQGKIEVYNAECNRAILHLCELKNCITSIISGLEHAPRKSIYNLSSHNTCIAKIANDIASRTHVITVFNSDCNTNKIDSFVLPNKPVGFSLNTDLFTRTFNYNFKSTPTDILDELLTSENIELICCSNLNYVQSEQCRVCKTNEMVKLLDLGSQPLANNYLSEPQDQKKFPLCLIRCKNCSHTQLNYTVPPEDMFSNYQYNSGVSNTLREYFKFIERKCTDSLSLIAPHCDHRCVLELACNDGTQLDIFKENGWETIGIDPATNILETTRRKGHEVYNMFWGSENIPNTLLNRKIDVIVAQNVVAHVPDPVLFLQKCNEIMTDETLLFVQTSQCDMYINGEFDTVYHEHLSYFTLDSMRKAAELSGLKLIDFEKTPIHGGSFLFTIVKNTSSQTIHTRVTEYKADYSDMFYVKYQSKVKTITDWLYKKINMLKSCGYDIVVYGAAAKGMTLLNCLNVDSGDIKYIVDDATMKHGKYSPNNICIYSPEKLKTINTKTAILILAWNFSSEIIKNINTLVEDKNTLIIVPFPEQKILKLSGEIIDENLIVQPSSTSNTSVVLLSHFYNEEFLLKWWIRQHAPLFDSAILVDYASTDSSLDIIKREAPESWKVVQSRNSMFDAEQVDREIMDIENSLPISSWKICLNTTEFLCAPGFRKTLNDSHANILQLQNHMMTGDDNLIINTDVNLIEQRYVYGPNVMFSNSYNRYIHRNHTNIYTAGRHGLAINTPVFSFKEGFLCKFIHTPVCPQNLARRVQIKTRIPERDIVRNFGENHLWSEQKQIQASNAAKNSSPQLHLNSIYDNPKFIKYFTNNFPNIFINY